MGHSLSQQRRFLIRRRTALRRRAIVFRLHFAFDLPASPLRRFFLVDFRASPCTDGLSPVRPRKSIGKVSDIRRKSFFVLNSRGSRLLGEENASSPSVKSERKGVLLDGRLEGIRLSREVANAEGFSWLVKCSGSFSSY